MNDDDRCTETTLRGARCRNRALDGWRVCWVHADVVERATSIVWAEQEAIEVEASMCGYLSWQLREYLQ